MLKLVSPQGPPESFRQKKAPDQKHTLTRGFTLCPRQDSNLRTRLRRAVLYPLSYGGAASNITASPRPD